MSQANVVAELDTAGIAAVLATQAAIKNPRLSYVDFLQLNANFDKNEPYRNPHLIAKIYVTCCLLLLPGRGQAGDGNTVRRAADVVQANVVAELDTAGIAAVLAAQAAIKNPRA